ncbi:MAG: PmoA family protein [Acidobacteriota bacterium]
MLLCWTIYLFLFSFLFGPAGQQVQLEQKADEKRVDVLIGGELFTSYHYGPEFDKPIFHPVKGPDGRTITRGFPMIPDIPGERKDHPHHQSMWFTYGDVNGINFWAKNPTPVGSIRHTGFQTIEGGEKGHLVATADWIAPDGQVLLRETTDAVFSGDSDNRIVDFKFTLTAQDQKVVFNDTKEGMFGIRVVSSLHEDQTGRYLSESGAQLEEGVWGKRSPWVALQGEVEGEDVSLVIFNHPESANYPNYWHARAYGLFAANPFGKKDFEEGSAPLNFSLEPGQSAQFQYRLLVHDGELSAEELKEEFSKYSAHR